MRTAMFALATMLLAGPGPVAAETPAEALTRGKLEADMGRLQSASAAFEAVAHASDATPEQRWEALVRLGVARRAAGDARGSADAFEETWRSYRGDPEAVRFLLQALGSALPGQERWDEAWEKVVIKVDRTHADQPVVGVVWPGASRLERARARQETISVDFKDADLNDIFRLLADVSGLNVVVQPGVSGKVTILARDLPWDELLEKVLAPYGFQARIDGNVLWIGRSGEAPRTGVAGEAIDVDFASVPLRDVLVEVAARGGARAVIPDGVAGRVTIRLRAVPWLQAFDLIANANGLVWERRGQVIEVRPRHP